MKLVTRSFRRKVGYMVKYFIKNDLFYALVTRENFLHLYKICLWLQCLEVKQWANNFFHAYGLGLSSTDTGKPETFL